MKPKLYASSVPSEINKMAKVIKRKLPIFRRELSFPPLRQFNSFFRDCSTCYSYKQLFRFKRFHQISQSEGDLLNYNNDSRMLLEWRIALNRGEESLKRTLHISCLTYYHFASLDTCEPFFIILIILNIVRKSYLTICSTLSICLKLSDPLKL